jgi:hypothetical protein
MVGGKPGGENRGDAPMASIAHVQNSSFQSPAFVLRGPTRLSTAEWPMRFGREVNSKWVVQLGHEVVAGLRRLRHLLPEPGLALVGGGNLDCGFLHAFATAGKRVGCFSLVCLIASSVIWVSGPAEHLRLSVMTCPLGSFRPRSVKSGTGMCGVRPPSAASRH